MPIPDTLLTFTIEGDAYEYKSFVVGKGWEDRKGTFGPEYSGTFCCRYKSIDDESAIQNDFRIRFMAGTNGVRERHQDAVMALLTLRQVGAVDSKKDRGGKDKVGLPAWCDFEKLGTELDETAVIAAFEKFRETMEGLKKD